MNTKIRRCDRCGRRYRGQEDWNIIYRHGVVVGYRCPDDQTTEDHTEAVINEATTGYGREVRPVDPDYFEAAKLHISATADDVFREFLEGVVEGGEAVEADPQALADETLRRLRPTVVDPAAGSTIHDDIVLHFRGLIGGLVDETEEGA